MYRIVSHWAWEEWLASSLVTSVSIYKTSHRLNKNIMEIENEIGVCVGTFDDRLGLWPKHDIMQ